MPQLQQLLEDTPLAAKLRIGVVDDVLSITVKRFPRIGHRHLQLVKLFLVCLASVRAVREQ